MLKTGRASLPDFRIFQTDEFLKKMGKLPTHESDFLEKKLNEYVFPQLRVEPFYGKNIKKLRNYTPKTWRYRIGRYRQIVLYCGFKRKDYLFANHGPAQGRIQKLDDNNRMQQNCFRGTESQVNSVC